MNSIRFGRCLLFACLTARLGWAQEVPNHVQPPVCQPAATPSGVAQLPAVIADQIARPRVGDPGSTGGVPSGAQFGPGPDGAGGIPNALVNLPPIPPESSQCPSSGASALAAVGPGGRTEVPRRQVKAITDPGGAGGLPESVRAPPSPVLSGDPDGVGSLPVVAPGPRTPGVSVGGNGTGGIRATNEPGLLPGAVPSSMTKTVSGVMIDASTQLPLAGALLVVIDPHAGIASLAITDDSGLFITHIDNESGFELAIPSEGIAGLPIEAGDILTIFVP